MAELTLRKKYYTGLQIIDAVKDLHLSYDDSLKLYGNLASISTDDVAPVVHGKWIKDRLISTGGGTYGVYRCSVCKSGYQDVGYGFDYCPYCGAKMDGGDHDATD